ncbi:MAG: NUDIX hydrolase [Planctomycetes bacterium]|nr:NUDIX hydrolase [Planctomycetota bacterium]
MIEPWERLASERRQDYRIFATRIDRYRSPATGETHAFVVVEAPDWVNVIALTPADEVVLVRQFRFGTREVTLEIPGGAVDPGEDFVSAGVRELREETGYAGDEVRLIGTVTPNPAFLENRCGTLLIPGARKVAEPAPEGTEILEVELCPRREIPRRLAAGQIRHALVVAAFQWLDLQEHGLR